MAEKYCRREIGTYSNAVGRTDTRLCMRRVSRVNPLNWCDECRKRLPLWPADDPPAPATLDVQPVAPLDCALPARAAQADPLDLLAGLEAVAPDGQGLLL